METGLLKQWRLQMGIDRTIALCVGIGAAMVSAVAAISAVAADLKRDSTGYANAAHNAVTGGNAVGGSGLAAGSGLLA
ncbi:MAG: hypothetical protein AAF501_12270, partial [Pseudomonadota bacterium]